jgi:hypothetical protein
MKRGREWNILESCKEFNLSGIQTKPGEITTAEKNYEVKGT